MDIKSCTSIFQPDWKTHNQSSGRLQNFSTEIVEHDLTDYAVRKVQLEFGKDDFALSDFLCMVEVPETFRKRMKGIKGQRTPAALIATYGNREYEDALLEMKDISEENGFYRLVLPLSLRNIP